MRDNFLTDKKKTYDNICSFTEGCWLYPRRSVYAVRKLYGKWKQKKIILESERDNKIQIQKENRKYISGFIKKKKRKNFSESVCTGVRNKGEREIYVRCNRRRRR